MKKQLYFWLMLLLPAGVLAQAKVPQGIWQLHGSTNQEVLAHLQFDRTSTGLRARIVAIPPGSVLEKSKSCLTCPKSDARYKQPLVGMEILRGMQGMGTRWVQGDWLDVERGFSYVADLEQRSPDLLILHVMYGNRPKPRKLTLLK